MLARRRSPVTIALTEDEGETFPYMRSIETGENFLAEGQQRLNRQYHYPSILQSRDGNLHISYTTMAGTAFLPPHRRSVDHRRIAGKGANDLTRSETAPRIRKGLSRRIWKYRWLYVFLIPALIWYIIFAYGPLYGLQIAFRDFKVLQGINDSEWVGLKHFIKMSTDRLFWRAAGNTVYISLIKLVFVSTSAW